MKLDKKYWEKRYDENILGWDIGSISTPLKTYIDQLTDKELKILIPGAGYGYEAMYFFELGFTNIHIIDIAELPLKQIKTKIPEFPDAQLIVADFFNLEQTDFDLVLEQTFFCALNPSLRTDYARKMYDLLKKGGTLSGLFFDFPLTKNGPPFGGSKKEYHDLFRQHFNIKTLERAYNSIPPRQGNELFFIFEK